MDHKSPVFREVRLYAALLFRQGHAPEDVKNHLLIQGVDEKIADAMIADLSKKEITGEFHVKQAGKGNMRLGIGLFAAGGLMAVAGLALGSPVIAVAALGASMLFGIPAISRGRRLLRAAQS